MKLWNFLKTRMKQHADKVAFSNGSITYKQLLAELESETQGTGRLRLIDCTKRVQGALELLRCIACGDVAVPIDSGYGQAYIDRVKTLICNDNATYRNTAFIVFTSGTTGISKGVMLSDRAIIENLKGIEGYCDVESGNKIMIIRPLVHIAVLVGELLFGLCRGMEIGFYEESFMPERLIATLNNNGTQVIGCTPTVLYRLCPFLDKTLLTNVFISGERLSPVMTALLKRYEGQIRFYNVYGLTENGPRVTALKPEEFFSHAGSVGKAIANTELNIEGGELLVRSASMMDGYYKRPDLSAEKLRGGWLHTGDAASVDEEGYVYILGRKDGMIIRSGLNIFPEDIETEMEQIDGVERCIVYGEDDIRYGQKLCLDYVGTASSKEVRKRLIGLIPQSMIPDRIRKVEMISETVSGKKVRK